MSRQAVKERLSDVRVQFDLEVEGPLRDRVYRALRTSILSGALVTGDRITEADLADALTVSRTPLREAFRGLQAEGLVAVSDRRGVVVRGMSAQDFLEIYEIREALDVVVARGAAKRMDAETLKKLADNIEMAEFLMQRQRWEELRQVFRQFHEIVQESCGNTRLSDLLSDLQDYSSGSSEFTMPSLEHAPSTHADHVRLYNAFVAGDEDAAAKAAYDHVQNERGEVVKATAAKAKTERKSA